MNIYQNNPMRGGKRINAGRKKGSNAYFETTKPIRVPLSLIEPLTKILQQVAIFKKNNLPVSFATQEPSPLMLPFFDNPVQAGFSSPVFDSSYQTLDLNHHLIDHPQTTFFVKVKGDSMIDAHIQEDDLLIVDRSLEAKHNDIVIAIMDTDITVKRLLILKEGIFLKPENKNYSLMKVPSLSHLTIWGVVTAVIQKVR